MLQRNNEQSVINSTVRAEVLFLVVGAIITTLARIWQNVEVPATILRSNGLGDRLSCPCWLPATCVNDSI